MVTKLALQQRNLRHKGGAHHPAVRCILLVGVEGANIARTNPQLHAWRSCYVCASATFSS
eukprot:7159714-Pyramimonas_sp.AAC.1